MYIAGYPKLSQHDFGCIASGKQSAASTVPETDDAALANALKGLRLQKAMDMASPPVTPPARIRRNNTPQQVLPGKIGDVPILGKDDSSNTKGSRPRAMKKVKNNSTKKSKKCRKNASKKGTCPKTKVEKADVAMPKPVTPEPAPASMVAPDGHAPAATPGSAETRAYAPGPKGSAPMPKANVPATMELVKKEEKKDIPRLPGLKTTTPTSVRMAKAVDVSQSQNLERADTQDQFAPSEPAGTEHYSPGYSPSLAPSQMDGDEEGELGSDYDEFLNSLPDDNDQDQETKDSRDSDQVSVADTAKTGNKEKKKGKKEKTPLQKAMHARYMKFSRSIRSN